LVKKCAVENSAWLRRLAVQALVAAGRIWQCEMAVGGSTTPRSVRA
jgi:hypothetical protein